MAAFATSTSRHPLVPQHSLSSISRIRGMRPMRYVAEMATILIGIGYVSKLQGKAGVVAVVVVVVVVVEEEEEEVPRADDSSGVWL